MGKFELYYISPERLLLFLNLLGTSKFLTFNGFVSSGVMEVIFTLENNTQRKILINFGLGTFTPSISCAFSKFKLVHISNLRKIVSRTRFEVITWLQLKDVVSWWLLDGDNNLASIFKHLKMYVNSMYHSGSRYRYTTIICSLRTQTQRK